MRPRGDHGSRQDPGDRHGQRAGHAPLPRAHRSGSRHARSSPTDLLARLPASTPAHASGRDQSSTRPTCHRRSGRCSSWATSWALEVSTWPFVGRRSRTCSSSSPAGRCGTDGPDAMTTIARPLAADGRQHQELLPRSSVAVLDARLPDHLRRAVRLDLLEQRTEHLQRWLGRPRSVARFGAAARGLRPGADRGADRRAEEDALAQMRDGDLEAVLVVPAGLGEALQPGSQPAQPFQLIVYTDPSQQTSSGTVQQVVAQVVGGVNQSLSGQPPALGVEPRPIQSRGNRRGRLLRAEHPRHGTHAARHLRRDPTRGAAREVASSSGCRPLP